MKKGDYLILSLFTILFVLFALYYTPAHITGNAPLTPINELYAPEVTDCATLMSPDTTYYLQNNLSGSFPINVIDQGSGWFTGIINSRLNENSTCIKINANNITLDCQGHSIFSSEGFNIYISEFDNITIKNCHLITLPWFNISSYRYNYSAYYKNIRSENHTDDLLIENNILEGGGFGNYYENITVRTNSIGLDRFIFRNNLIYKGGLEVSFNNEFDISGNTIETDYTRGISVVYIGNGVIYNNTIKNYALNTYDGGGIYAYGTHKNFSIIDNTIFIYGEYTTLPTRSLSAIGYRKSDIDVISGNHMILYGNENAGITSSWWGENISNLIIKDNIIDVYGNLSQGIYLRGRHENVSLYNNTINFLNNIYNSYYFLTSYPMNLLLSSNKFLHQDSNSFEDVYGFLDNSLGLGIGRNGENLFFNRQLYGSNSTKILYELFPKIDLLEPTSSLSFNLSSIQIQNTSISIDLEASPWLNKSAVITIYNSNKNEFIEKVPMSSSNLCPIDVCTEIQDNNTYIFNMTHLTSLFGIMEGCGSDIACINLIIIETPWINSSDIIERDDVSLDNSSANINLTDSSFWANNTLRVIFYQSDDFGFTNRIPFVNNLPCNPPMCIEIQDQDTYIYDVNLTYINEHNIILIDLSVGEGCGDLTCESQENCSLCSNDCGPCSGSSCGDGLCNNGENCSSCETDCNSCSLLLCGDGLCNNGETCSICSADCGNCSSLLCGDGQCDASESCLSCATDCGACPVCGNSQCDASESCSTCSVDCGACQSSSSGGSSGGGGSSPGKYYDNICKPHTWKCGDWSKCVGIFKLRNCQSNCGTFKEEYLVCEQVSTSSTSQVEETPTTQSDIIQKKLPWWGILIILILIIIGIYFFFFKRKKEEGKKDQKKQSQPIKK